MKFSQSLKFNAVADWWDDYIAYGYLKKQIYLLEKQQAPAPRYRDVEEGEALLRNGEGTDKYFRPLLDKELLKITTFYESQQKELYDELDDLEEQIRRKDEQGLRPEGAYADVDDDDDDYESHSADLSRSLSNTRSAERQRSDSNAIDRRLSISSSEDGADLEASMFSGHLRSVSGSQELPTEPLIPEDRELSHSRSQSSTRGGLRISKVFRSILHDHDEHGESVWTAKTNYAYDTRALFKRRITTLFINLASLRSYVELNYTGFRKILKKYDKVTYSDLRHTYMHDVVEPAYPFLQTTRGTLKENIARLVALYAKCITKGDFSQANKQLRVHQREHIAWERDTVWRQMIGNERRGQPSGHSHVLQDSEPDLPGTTSSNFVIRTPAGELKFKKKKLFLPVALVVFIALLNSNVVEGVEANNCFAILVFATLLWASEAIPLFVTSMMIPLLLVVFRTVRSIPANEDDVPKRLDTSQATKFIFSAMFSPTIMLLIGGFTIAAAISKTNIDRVLITRVLALAGSKPRTVLLAFMGVACFASMWISNVAAPTLCFTLIQPILRTLPPKASFGPCLILAIALAANIGGQSSPISSPQNLIALQYMDPPIDWLNWFIVALPVSFISIILIWLLLLVSYKPSITADGEPLEIRPIRSLRERFTLKQWWVTIVCLVTIALWCIEHKIEEYVGDMGVIAIIPIVAFFSTGVLKKDDFEQFLWSIVFLAMGGIALGKAVDSSGLLGVMDQIVHNMIEGLSLFGVVAVLSVVVLVISTFISHTIASVLLVPIALQVGSQFEDPHPRLLIFITALICSTGMGMPVSGFPNQTAANQVDEMGKPYLTNVDFLKNGVPASIIATIVVSTVGFLLMRLIGL
ncbi:hypothetical protein M422DRAFT_204101 [Sphaerobolus stellatus SS14]|nr:hypothetical protein M422DRAFT_204101 [Sphaerobolus stellatus SS14]